MSLKVTKTISMSPELVLEVEKIVENLEYPSFSYFAANAIKTAVKDLK